MIKQQIMKIKEKNALTRADIVFDNLVNELLNDGLENASLAEAIEYIMKFEDSINDILNHEIEINQTNYQMIIDFLIMASNINYYSFSNLNNNQYAYIIMTFKIYFIYRAVARIILLFKEVSYKQFKLINKMNIIDRTKFIMDKSKINPLASVSMYFINLLEELNDNVKENNGLEDFYNIIFDENNVLQLLSIISSISESFEPKHEEKYNLKSLIRKYDFLISLDNGDINYEINSIENKNCFITENVDNETFEKIIHWIILKLVDYKKEFNLIKNL